jgi:hypothetical protein
MKRASYVFLCAFPLLVLMLASPRVLRSSPVHEVVGIVMFVCALLAMWVLGVRALGAEMNERRLFALSGSLLLVPSTLIALLWVGIGAPFQATLAENHMRYLVLVTSTICITAGFVVLKEALREAGEGFYSSAGLAAALAAGTAYLVCICISLAQVGMRVHGNTTVPPAIIIQIYSALEFVACIMTYLATALFAMSIARVRVIARGAALAYVIVSIVMLALIVMRGVEFPEISGRTAPWYTQPGVIAGIPAIPWLMPGLWGAVLLKRAGEEGIEHAKAH